MTKRYREAVEVLPATTDARCSPGPGAPGAHGSPGQVVPGSTVSGPTPSPVAPTGFVWRGSTYRVVAILGHWREDGGYWAGGGVEIPQRDLWRVEARNGTPATGVYELVCEQDVWRLDRVWD